MKPFLLIGTRADDHLAELEVELFARFGNIDPSNLDVMRLEAEPMGDVDLSTYSGIIVGGSPFTSSIPVEEKSETQLRVEMEIQALLGEVVATDFPFLGCCYGVGTLARHQGGVIDTRYGEEVAAPVLTMTEAGQADPILEGIPHQFRSFVGHKEACSVLPETATLLVSGTNCPNQMFRVGQNLYGTQFHPELDAEALETRLRVYKNHGYVKPEDFDSIIEEIYTYDVSASHKIIENFIRIYAAE